MILSLFVLYRETVVLHIPKVCQSVALRPSLWQARPPKSPGRSPLGARLRQRGRAEGPLRRCVRAAASRALRRQ